MFARNSVRDPEENGILVGVSRCFQRAEACLVAGSVVRRNHVRGAGEDGVHLNQKTKHTLLRGNHARHSKADGIDVESGSTKLTKNRALRNGGLGIEAVRGVIDGGGNIARFSGNPLQCTNIACS